MFSGLKGGFFSNQTKQSTNNESKKIKNESKDKTNHSITTIKRDKAKDEDQFVFSEVQEVNNILHL